MTDDAAPLRARCGEIELAYERIGDGPRRVLLIMGIGSQRIFWDDRLCARLADAGCTVVRFDHRDVGQSTRLDHLPVPRPGPTMTRHMLHLPFDAPYTLSDMARDVVGLLDHLGWDRAHVVGASMGGMIAQHLAIEHPTRLASLTSIMSTTGARRYALLARPSAMKALLAKPPRTAEESGDYAVKLFRTIGGSRFPTDDDHVRRMGRLAFERKPAPRGFCRHFAAMCKSGDRTTRLATVRAPTLVVHGAADPLIPVAAGRATARAIPGARLHVIDGMGHHMPPGTWPEFVPAILSLGSR